MTESPWFESVGLPTDSPRQPSLGFKLDGMTFEQIGFGDAISRVWGGHCSGFLTPAPGKPDIFSCFVVTAFFFYLQNYAPLPEFN